LLNDYENQFMQHCIPFQGLLEMLTLLEQQNYSLGIITNGRGAFQSRAIQGLGIENFFDVVLVSEVEQVRKPEAEIFDRALQRLNTNAETTVFVGDHPEADILGARNAGLRAIWKRNAFWPEPDEADAIIDELGELPGIVQQL
jgi:putative hydrolase of the HAD superfamily